MFGETLFCLFKTNFGDALSGAPSTGASVKIGSTEVLYLKSSLEHSRGLWCRKWPAIPPPAVAFFFFKWQKHSPKRCITEEREVGGEEQQRDLNLAAARRLEGTGSRAQTKWSAAFGGFLFLHCLGLGFVLELVLGDEGCRSEAPSPGWRLSQGGMRQERRLRGLPALARSPQIRSRGWSRELGSSTKTSLPRYSLLQQSCREQGVLHLWGSS